MRTQSKIAFLFLTREGVLHSRIWEDFFSRAQPDDYSIYLHTWPRAAKKVRGFFRNFVVPKPIRTRYSHVSVVRAMNLLLRAALEDEPNGKFVLLSETTLPARSFREVALTLEGVGKSIFYVCPHEQCWPRCRRLLKWFPEDVVQKSHQWAILNRGHAELMVREEAKWLRAFKRMPAADEHYWITMIHHHGLQAEIVSDWMTTFASWQNETLRNFRTLSEENVSEILGGRCLFARKFLPECNVDDLWKEVVRREESALHRQGRNQQ